VKERETISRAEREAERVPRAATSIRVETSELETATKCEIIGWNVRQREIARAANRYTKKGERR